GTAAGLPAPWRGPSCSTITGRLPPRPGINELPRKLTRVCASPRMSTAVTTVKPTHNSVYNKTPSAPPNTQASCSVDSERPKPDARDSSGRSFCSEASSEAFAIALDPEVTKVAITATIRLPATAAAKAAAHTATVQRT